MRLTTLLLTLFCLAAGCNRPRFDTPVAAYQSFHRLVQKGELQQAYEALSTPTRAWLADQARTVSEASRGAVQNDPVSLFFANATRPPDVSELSVARENGETAAVRVVVAGEASEVLMVREPTGWKLDLREVAEKRE